MSEKKLWGGRFTKSTDSFTDHFHSSISFDSRMYKEDIEAGKVTFDEKAEDIHMNVETILISRIGDVGKRLHTGRSRNDQVALDIRMYLKEQIVDIKALVKELITVLNNIAERYCYAWLHSFTECTACYTCSPRFSLC